MQRQPVEQLESAIVAESAGLRLDDLLASPPRPAASGPAPLGPAVAVGTLVGFAEAGEPLVTLKHGTRTPPLPARSTVRLGTAELGREVVLAFADADVRQPIVLGVLQPSERSAAKPTGNPIEVSQDGERLLLTADREIVLRCGDASITLTQAGKVLLRGNYLLSRSSGANLIKGGSVQIN